MGRAYHAGCSDHEQRACRYCTSSCVGNGRLAAILIPMKTRQAENEEHVAGASASSNAGADTRGYRAWDKLAIALAVLLVAALGAASLYGFKYGKVDTSVAVGKVTIKKGEEVLLKMTVDEDMQAQVRYHQKRMTGTLVFAGAETDTILFQLQDIKYKDGSDASDAVLFMRMPRSGVQGDLSGAWMTYFSQPSTNENCSEWVIAHEDGTADYGLKDKLNAITAQRFKLVELSEEGWTWEKKKSVLQLQK